MLKIGFLVLVMSVVMLKISLKEAFFFVSKYFLLSLFFFIVVICLFIILLIWLKEYLLFLELMYLGSFLLKCLIIWKDNIFII